MLSTKSEALLPNMRRRGAEIGITINVARRDCEATAGELAPTSFRLRSRPEFPYPCLQKRGTRLDEPPISPRQAKMLRGAACCSDTRPRIPARRTGRAVFKS